MLADHDVTSALAQAQLARDSYLPCGPGILEDEYCFNPYMRCHHQLVAKSGELRILGTCAEPLSRSVQWG